MQTIPKPIPKFIINSVASIRICDNGGWADTWFAEYGKIFNIGVSPGAEVQIAVFDAAEVGNRIVINAENYGERYAFDPKLHSLKRGWNQHPLLEAAIEYMQIPDQLAIEVTIYSEAPAGASMGSGYRGFDWWPGCFHPGTNVSSRNRTGRSKGRDRTPGRAVWHTRPDLLSFWQNYLY